MTAGEPFAERAARPAYRDEEPGPGVRLDGIVDVPIGQSVLFDDVAIERAAHSALLTDRFVVPPFSVLDTRAGYWQSRKAQWLALGIQSELGRGMTVGEVSTAPTVMDAKWQARSVQEVRLTKHALPVTGYAGQVNRERAHRRAADLRSNLTGAAPLPEYADNGTAHMAPGTSIFDPVVCEIAYRWFAPPAGTVLDPFAGGSVRGIVASMLGHRYTGIDLSHEQVEANRVQADAILGGGNYPPPVWIQGDSAHLTRLLTEPMQYDLLFSCPPYYDLEVYSDAPGELSAMEDYPAFLRAYGLIIRLAAERLRDERFAVWVVGEIRDKQTGMARGFVSDTIQLFIEAGLHLYNEAVLINPVGTLALRAPRQFVAGRKLGRSHQAVLVFWKGRRSPLEAFRDFSEEVAA